VTARDRDARGPPRVQNGMINAHCASVTSLGYGFRSPMTNQRCSYDAGRDRDSSFTPSSDHYLSRTCRTISKRNPTYRSTRKFPNRPLRAAPRGHV
jgi:hypothetical protein